jgi:hypothetical protein
MAFAPFFGLFPDIARRETRIITIKPGAPLGLPAGDYGWLEMYCDEAGCDCRRVFFMVVCTQRKETDAVIAWGWEDRAFYAGWLGRDDAGTIDELQGPILNVASPQSSNAPALLDLARTVLLADADYVARIKRHYAMFREKIEAGGEEKSAKSDKKKEK